MENRVKKPNAQSQTVYRCGNRKHHFKTKPNYEVAKLYYTTQNGPEFDLEFFLRR